MSDLDQYPDLAGPGLSVDFHASIEANTRATAAMAAQLDRFNRDNPAPVFYRPHASGIIPASLALNLSLGGPDQGSFWYVRSIAVGGTDPTVAAAGVADVFVLPADPGTGQPSTGAWRDRATSLPLTAFYGRGDIYVRANERLVIRFTAATAAQLYVAAASVENYQDHAGRQSWVM